MRSLPLRSVDLRNRIRYTYERLYGSQVERVETTRPRRTSVNLQQKLKKPEDHHQMLQLLIEHQDNCRIALFSPDSPLECYEAGFCHSHLELLELRPQRPDLHNTVYFNMFEIYSENGIHDKLKVEPRQLSKLNNMLNSKLNSSANSNESQAQTTAQICKPELIRETEGQFISQAEVRDGDFMFLQCCDFEQVLVFDRRAGDTAADLRNENKN